MSTKGIGTTVDATTILVSWKSINSNQNVTCFSPVQFKQQSREEEGGDKFWRWKITMQRTGSCFIKESMSTKGIHATVDATMIPVSCKSINSNQNVPSSNNNQQDIQTKINLQRKSRVLEVGWGKFWGDGRWQCCRRWELSKWHLEVKGRGRADQQRMRHVFQTPIKCNKQTTQENKDCWRCCGWRHHCAGSVMEAMWLEAPLFEAHLMKVPLLEAPLLEALLEVCWWNDPRNCTEGTSNKI